MSLLLIFSLTACSNNNQAGNDTSTPTPESADKSALETEKQDENAETSENTETKEKLLIYQALYGSNVIFARPLDMAMGVVDKEKYPDIKQEYRFEEINNENINSDKLLWNLLEKHIGHEVHIESYGDNNGNIADVCLECEDCNEVILDSEIYTLAARNDKED